METVSLYIHIPFCIKKCNYCDFLSFDNKFNLVDDYINALINEIKNYSISFSNKLVKSIFIGGGTPSILSSYNIYRLMDIIHKQYNINNDAEITLECNPGTLNIDKVRAIKNSGINRLSIGLQSTDDSYLDSLGRIHSYNDFVENYSLVRNIGINNINVDLMFGLPNQTLSNWESTVKEIIKLEPEHISAYGLIIEEETNFYRKYYNNELSLPDETIERDMYWLVHNILKDNNYNHYEISNYAQNGYECKHNIVYWTMEEYIGLGLGASSFVNGYRNKNTSDLNDYLRLNGDINKILVESNSLTRNQFIEEYIFLGLRLLEGINVEDFESRFGLSIFKMYKDIIQDLVNNELIEINDKFLRLTDKGIDVSNYVFAKFLN